VAETNGLLNRRTGKSGTEGSNPSVSANLRPRQRKRANRFRTKPIGARNLIQMTAFSLLPRPCLASWCQNRWRHAVRATGWRGHPLRG
jgi:hypothetical protein